MIGIPFAFAEITTGQNYFDIDNGDGTRTLKSHHPYVFDGNNWTPYIASGTQIQTHMGTVTLNGTGYFQWNGKFNDSIKAKYADISDLNTWTYPNTLNNDVPDISWDGSQLVSEKEKAGIGNLKYKYIFDNGKWKTQLEATNLSSLTTKVFGFDQTIDLNSDTIKFGGVTRNLDNFHGQTFSKEFLNANQGKILDLLNGINFDFDLGYENLYSITVYDTGVNSSRLVFDYRTTEILLPGETLIIDPTFLSSPTVTGRAYGQNGVITTSCAPGSYSGFLKDATVRAFMGDSDLASQCGFIYMSFNSTSIPDEAVFQSGFIELDVTATAGTVDEACDVVLTDPSINMTSATATDIYAEIYNETREIVSGNTFCQSTGNNKQLSITLTDTEIRENRVNLGFDFADNTRSPTDAYSFDLANVELSITYSTDRPTEFDVTINSAVVGDTNKINGTITLTRGNPLPITLDSIEILRNGTQINLNNTNSTFSSLGQTINFGDIWNRMTTGEVFNFTAFVTIDNATGTQITNSSSSFASREYDPSYAPAVDDPAVQGNVNATVERFDNEDSILLKVNREGGTLSETWQIECISQTNTQAAQTKNQSSTWLGDWINETNTGYFNRTYSGYANSHAYITCFNDDELFSLTSYTNSSLALLGIQLFDDSYGAMLGVPVGVFFLVMTAGMANKRTAPTFIIVITGIAGTMATIGFFSFEPLVWGLALVTAMLGIFVNQKIF